MLCGPGLDGGAPWTPECWLARLSSPRPGHHSPKSLPLVVRWGSRKVPGACGQLANKAKSRPQGYIHVTVQGRPPAGVLD